MFERFTDRARKSMALANQEAQRFKNENIGSEHILLGLLIEGSGVGFNVLKNLGADPVAVRRKVESLIESGCDVVSMGKLPQTPRAKKVIEFAIEEARALGNNYVGTEHLLLGLLCEEGGIARKVLSEFSLTVEAARQELRAMLQLDESPSASMGRLYHVRHQGKSYWVEAHDLEAATAVWKRRFGRVPSGDEYRIEDPNSIEMVFEGPVWR